MLTGEASDCDEVAQEVIDSIQSALLDPMSAANDPETRLASAQARLRDATLPRDHNP
jgi:hypothetical protein